MKYINIRVWQEQNLTCLCAPASCLKLIGAKKLCQNSLGMDHAPFLLNFDYGGLFYFDVQALG